MLPCVMVLLAVTGLVLGLLSFSLANCFTRWQVFSRGGGFGQGKDWERVVNCQIKAKVADWRVAAIAQTKLPHRVVPEFIAIFIHSQYQKARIVAGQLHEVFLRNRTDGGNKHGLSRYYRAFSLLPYRTSFLIPSSNGQSFFVWVGIGNPRVLFASLAQETSHGSPSELRRQMPTVLKVNNYFYILVRVLWDYKISDDSILPANCHIGPLGYAQSVLRDLPLFLRVLDVDVSQAHNREGSNRLYTPVVSIKKLEWKSSPSPQYFESAADCYDRPHYVLGIISLLGAVCFLGLAGGCWGSERGFSAKREFGLFTLGLACLCISLWLVCHGLGLIYFKVYPCASFSSSLHPFTFLAHCLRPQKRNKLAA